jgi:hyperosmotically inducible protein
MSHRQHAAVAVLVCGLAVPFVSGCATASSRARAAAVDDAYVTTRVKTALINDTEAFDPRIEVDTVKGVVTLSGRVQTKEQEAKAIALARGVQGVTDVKSTLQVQP